MSLMRVVWEGVWIIWKGGFIFLFWHPKVRARKKFEASYTDSFPPQMRWLFHVSSEGEWQQMRPVVEKLLNTGTETLYLYFTSLSVASTLKNSAALQPRLKIRPLPFFSKITHRPQNFFMVRYDFFPQLMLLALHPQTYSCLLWASLKPRREWSSKPFKKILQLIYNCFDLIVPATEIDKQCFGTLKLRTTEITEVCDLRVLQIDSRLSWAEQTLKQKLPFYPELIDYLKNFPQERRWTWGSVWPFDLELIACIPPDEMYFLALFPHEIPFLSVSDVEKLTQRSCLIVTSQTTASEFQQLVQKAHELKHKVVWLFLVKGLLCEFYSLSGLAYVGGGFGKSVHSVMEPFWAKNHVIVGPRCHRSTEVEWAQEFSKSLMAIIKDKSDFSQFVSNWSKAPLSSTKGTPDLTKMPSWLDNKKHKAQLFLERWVG